MQTKSHMMGETPPFFKMRECKEAEAEIANCGFRFCQASKHKERLALLNFIIVMKFQVTVMLLVIW